jgi:hypothetical protein
MINDKNGADYLTPKWSVRHDINETLTIDGVARYAMLELAGFMLLLCGVV